ncbi:SurA N-terminal domain-containing protein, partial [Candidatus Parcubacteria bacterium]|nr:SurA N-terminal domain-containing protein [Candidatus Parcubacteria bacterium]
LPRVDRIDKRKLTAFLGVAALVVVAYRFRSQVIVATVNGQPVTRLALIQRLERQAGKPTLDNLITEVLIYQEAAEQNASATDEEVAEKVAQLEANLNAQGQQLSQVLGAQGVSWDEMEEQTRLQILVEKLAGQGIEVTDEEIDEYIEANRDFLPEETDPAELREDVRAQLEGQKFNEAIQSWLAELHEGATIKYLLDL